MEYHFDYLVLGSGIAGLSIALKAARLGNVAIITKKEKMESNTNLAQGGIAGVMDAADSFEDHVQDTLRAGAGLCREDVVRMVVEGGPRRIRELLRLGVEFTRDEKGLHLGREGGHSHRRIVHAHDLTGREIERALIRACEKQDSRIHFFEHHFAIDLLTMRRLGRQGEDRCFGAYVLDTRTGEVHTFLGNMVILATGGCGKVYKYTTNPDIATGDGIAMAWRAGADIANMEFFQFHPTCLFHAQAKRFLVSEAVRGEGALLKRLDGKRFMPEYSPNAELAPRDVVARAIDREMKKTGHDYVLLDISHKGEEFVKEHFPYIYNTLLEYGFNMGRSPVPVVPAAHYSCGGVMVDVNGATTIPGLYACGEVACTGLHGANRLASNSLLEALVFAERIWQSAREAGSCHDDHVGKVPPWNPGHATEPDEMVVVSHNWDEIRSLMWNYVGIVRTNKRLERALSRIQLLKQEIREYYWNFKINPDLLELRNIAVVAEIIIRCAMMRLESRGLHYNLSYPERDDANFRHDTVIRRGKGPKNGY